MRTPPQLWNHYYEAETRATNERINKFSETLNEKFSRLDEIINLKDQCQWSDVILDCSIGKYQEVAHNPFTARPSIDSYLFLFSIWKIFNIWFCIEMLMLC